MDQLAMLWQYQVEDRKADKLEQELSRSPLRQKMNTCRTQFNAKQKQYKQMEEQVAILSDRKDAIRDAITRCEEQLRHLQSRFEQNPPTELDDTKALLSEVNRFLETIGSYEQEMKRMAKDANDYDQKERSLLPRKSKKSIEQQAREIDRTLAGFIRGQLSVCVILGSFYAVGLHLAGLDLGLLVGFLAGIISFIPYVGTISGFIISMALAFAQFDSLMPIISVAAVFMVGQFLEGNFLTPKLVGDNVGLHPVWVMFALLAGGVLLGFLGLMIAVPVAAIIGVLIRHAIMNYKKSSLYLED